MQIVSHYFTPVSVSRSNNWLRWFSYNVIKLKLITQIQLRTSNIDIFSNDKNLL